MRRLGGEHNLSFGFPSQPGAIHFLRYDYDLDKAVEGRPVPLKVAGEGCTTVEKVSAAFSNVGLPEPNVYEAAIRTALYD